MIDLTQPTSLTLSESKILCGKTIILKNNNTEEKNMLTLRNRERNPDYD